MTFIKLLLEDKETAATAIERELFARSSYLIGEATKSFEVVSNSRITEMRDAPDQTAYGMTRREVEKMLTKYERREDDNTGRDNPEPRSVAGMQRARWYAPEHNSDFANDYVDDGIGMDGQPDDRPAKAMPYDYEFSVNKPNDTNKDPHDVIDDHDTDNSKEDWSGERNRFFKESVEESVFIFESQDDAASNVAALLHDSSENQYPVEFHLDDGNFVAVDPEHAKAIISAGRANDILDHIDSMEAFQAFLHTIFGDGDDDSDDISDDISIEPQEVQGGA